MPSNANHMDGQAEARVDSRFYIKRDDFAFLLPLLLAAHPDLLPDYTRMAEISRKIPNPELWTSFHEIYRKMYLAVELAQRIRDLPPLSVNSDYIAFQEGFTPQEEAAGAAEDNAFEDGEYYDGDEDNSGHDTHDTDDYGMDEAEYESDTHHDMDYYIADYYNGFLDRSNDRAERVGRPIAAEAAAAAAGSLQAPSQAYSNNDNNDTDDHEDGYNDDGVGDSNSDDAASVVSSISGRVWFGPRLTPAGSVYNETAPTTPGGNDDREESENISIGGGSYTPIFDSASHYWHASKSSKPQSLRPAFILSALCTVYLIPSS
ncbi:hypothetical protein VTN00DRAFT_2831 [Thermoascus crustaceus]|uniref:uncharacterized protein n=1 Tax=Thermoascus crustaceus TaxID=5088 RepID=UPI003742BE4C